MLSLIYAFFRYFSIFPPTDWVQFELFRRRKKSICCQFFPVVFLSFRMHNKKIIISECILIKSGTNEWEEQKKIFDKNKYQITSNAFEGTGRQKAWIVWFAFRSLRQCSFLLMFRPHSVPFAKQQFENSWMQKFTLRSLIKIDNGSPCCSNLDEEVKLRKNSINICFSKGSIGHYRTAALRVGKCSLFIQFELFLLFPLSE